MRKMHGESGSVHQSSLQEKRVELQTLIENYAPEDVYNFDETGLFYRMKPSQTLATKKIAGKKKDNTRISIGLCCNMDGSSKEDPVIINKSQKPRCFKGHDIAKLPIKFYANKKAWMTSMIFTDWLKQFNLKMCGRSVLLLVDNASAHVTIQLSNVKVYFLPPNTTSHLQPLDAGVVKSFKSHYRRSFLKWTLAQIESKTDLKNMDFLTCISYVIDAWKQVSPTTIRNCWTHTCIVSAPMAAVLKQQNEPTRQSVIPELDALIAKLSLDDPMSADSYVTFAEENEEIVDDDDEMTQENQVEGGVAEDDEEDDETSVLTHREAIEAATKLSVYASLHGLDHGSLKQILDSSQAAVYSGMRQSTIDSFFASVN